MRTTIYQINPERDTHRVKFMELAALERLQGNAKVDASLYDQVFSGDLEETELEQVFQRFNLEGHPLHRGHSLSVSDVVVNENGAFFCDSVGFQQIDFEEGQTQKPENLLRVVYVEPGRAPYETEIDSSLRGLQKAVGGLIEPLYLEDGCILVCNEEGKLHGMPGNRRLGDSIIAGPLFICGDEGENFRSLTDEEVNHYLRRFAEPEQISDEEVQADMGYSIFFMS